MDKTLRNGLIMSEMDPLNHKWFVQLVWEKFILEAPDSTLFLEGLRGFGGVDDLKRLKWTKPLGMG